MKRLLQFAIVALPTVLLASCHPTIPVSSLTEGTVWSESTRPSERQGSSLSAQQIQLLAAWINGRKDGWELDPFVTYVPCVYVILREDDEPVCNVSICSRSLVVGYKTQYTRSISDAEHEELLAAIGAETKWPPGVRTSEQGRPERWCRHAARASIHARASVPRPHTRAAQRNVRRTPCTASFKSRSCSSRGFSSR